MTGTSRRHGPDWPYREESQICGESHPRALPPGPPFLILFYMTDAVFQRCIHPDCAATVPVDDTSFRCPRCGGLLDVVYDWNRLPPPRSLRDFEAKWTRRSDPLCFSGVWPFRELLPFA